MSWESNLIEAAKRIDIAYAKADLRLAIRQEARLKARPLEGADDFTKSEAAWVAAFREQAKVKQ
jgi:hypothetical protein